MSLTSLLNDESSYVYQWFNSKLNPAMQKLVDQHNNMLANVNILKPAKDTNFPLTGSAYTYHIRHKLCGLDQVFSESIAFKGALIMNAMLNKPKYKLDTFNGIHKLCSNKVEALAFAYMLLAALEQVGRGKPPSDFLLKFCKDSRYLPESSDAIGKKYLGTITDLINLINHTTLDIESNEPRYINPTFAGSSYVGGADAQLIVDGNLIDIRTTAKRYPFTVKNLWQQIGYILLDFENKYQIKNVCWYYSRQQVLLKHPVEKLFKDLSKTRQEFLSMLIQQEEEQSELNDWTGINSRYNCPDDMKEFFGF